MSSRPTTSSGSGDKTHQPHTSLRYIDRTSLNANHVPFIALPQPVEWPKRYGISLGDLAAVIYRDRLAYAVFGDFKRPQRIGEGSVQLFRELGEERVRDDGTLWDVDMGPGVITIVFPGSGRAEDRRDEHTLLDAVRNRGAELFINAGGSPPR